MFALRAWLASHGEKPREIAELRKAASADPGRSQAEPGDLSRVSQAAPRRDLAAFVARVHPPRPCTHISNLRASLAYTFLGKHPSRNMDGKAYVFGA